MSAPPMKDFAPWGYRPRAPFYIVASAYGAVTLIDQPFENFDKLLDIWVRECLMPESVAGPSAVVLDDDGVAVIGWLKRDEGYIWIGLEWAWGRVTHERYPFLRPMMIEEARLSVINFLEVGAP